MENKEKYYYPSVEEIRIGYECEVNNSKGYSSEYVSTVITLKDVDGAYLNELDDITVMMHDGYGEVRVPFLTKEQIEAEGWKFKETNKLTYWFRKEIGEFDKARDYYNYSIYSMLLMWTPSDNRLKVFMNFSGLSDETEQENDDKMFEGECKDINTFRYIMKLLNIK